MEFAFVSATDVQTGGPDYDFRIGRFEVRNDQFVVFLNDARVQFDTARGAFLFFDTVTGDVYVNTSEIGEAGPSPGGRALKIFSPSVAGQIELRNGTYRVVDDPIDFSAHPVAGVSWFGAVKFCNWMTLASGLPESERAYAEGVATSPSAWRPATIGSSWALRDLNDTEREALVGMLGYRLPMDGGVGEVDPYGEWFKAASARPGAAGVVFDAVYGFARAQITPADANYLDSNDPFESGSAPVGFFDGTTFLGDGTTPTTNTANAYGLYDVSGNVWEWVQDQSATGPLQRRNRGGSWRSVAGALRNSIGSARLADSTVDSTGFRVVQSVLGDIVVAPFDGLSLTGPWGGPYNDDAVTTLVYRIENVVDRTIDLSVSTDETWLAVSPVEATVSPGAFVDVTVSLALDCADPLSVGAHDGAIRVREVGGNVLATRFAHLAVTEPLQLAPANGHSLTRSFGDDRLAPTKTYTATNRSAADVSWSVAWAETSTPATGLDWLTIDGEGTGSGTLLPGGIRSFTVAIDPNAASLLPVGVHTADVTFTDNCTGTTFVRTVEVAIVAPFTVTPTGDGSSSGAVGGPFVPSSHEFTITNELDDRSVDWSVVLCAAHASDLQACIAPSLAWITLTPATGDVPQNGTAMVTATINPSAQTLPSGEHRLTIRFTQPATGFLIDRDIVLTITGLDVRPVTGGLFSGSLRGPFTPAGLTYAVHNAGAGELPWSASITYDTANNPTGIAWLEVSPDFGVILDPFGSQPAVLRVTDPAVALAPGTYTATVKFEAGIASATRGISLSIGNEGFRVSTALVPGDDVQFGGPVHDFRLGRHEVTNADFARFLNDALVHLNDARGAYLYHDIDSGSVYIHDGLAGEVGSDAPGSRWTTKLYDGSVGRVHYDPSAALPYVVEVGFAQHPIAGVSWFGAVKFCNWLTITQGMAEDARVYVEGPTPGDWRSASDDFDTIRLRPGFRLPMDGGATGASPHNEWYKAASRGGVDQNDLPVFGSVYGFGRNTLSPSDANFANNGDTDGDGTTPVGFFDGVNELFDGGSTTDTENGYGFDDLTGNVAEWVHDVVDNADVPSGATRGGHFAHAADAASLRTNVREARPSDATFAFVGFRVAQSITPVALAVEVDAAALAARGPVGGPYDRTMFNVALRNDADYTADDFTVTLGASWLAFDGVAPRLVPPHSTVDVPLRLSDQLDALNVGAFEATVDVVDNITGETAAVTITLDLTEPLSIDGEDRTDWTGHFCDDHTDFGVSFLMTNRSAAEMPWSVTVDVDWLEVARPNGGALSDTIPGAVDGLAAAEMFTVTPNELAGSLAIGEHEAVITFTNERTNKSVSRTIVLTVTPPIEIEPSDDVSRTFTLSPSGTIGALSTIDATLTRCALCRADCALEYAIAVVDDWLTVEPIEHLLGIVPPPGESVPLTVRVNDNAEGFAPGAHMGKIDISVFDVAADRFVGLFTYEVTLDVLDPIVVDAGDPMWDVGCALDLTNPPTRSVSLTNLHEVAEIGVRLAVDVPWIDVEPMVPVRPGETETIELTLNDLASSVFGTQEVTLSVTDTLTAHVWQIDLTVNIAGAFCVTPLAGFDAFGAVNQGIIPTFRLFQIGYVSGAADTIDWRGTSDQPWLTVDGASSVTGTIVDGARATVQASIDEALLSPMPAALDEQTLEATLTFENMTDGSATTRRIRVLRVRPPFRLDERSVPKSATEPGGPTYSFLMGRTHVTNAQFARFLNDALAHPNDPRGRYLFFNTTTGDVFINDAVAGATGPDSGGLSVSLYAPDTSDRIEFADGVYSVVTQPVDYSDHPVVGVSWFGAVKYCNWLTIAQGLGAHQRCFDEGTADDLNAWRPTVITTTNWSSRDLTDAERLALVTSCRGYRLPMDDGYTNADPQTDGTDAYNEWYKAGAWDDAAQRHRLYGFGRDTLTAADANYRCSGDPFEDAVDCALGGTTPVGFYDGTLQTAGDTPFATNAPSNGFGLMDMTGNAYQWMQGRYAPSASIDRRSLRGGSWNDEVGTDALRMTRRILWAVPGATNAQVGFRVVRVPPMPEPDVDGNGVVNQLDVAHFYACETGPDTGLRGGCARADWDEDGDVDLRDAATFFVEFKP